MRVTIREHAGSFAEDKDIARRLRQEVVEGSLAKGEAVILDFSGVELATQSFIHALICDVIRKNGAKVLDKLTFKGCNGTVKSLVRTVSEYSQDVDKSDA
jgi:hypothetical protein